MENDENINASVKNSTLSILSLNLNNFGRHKPKPTLNGFEGRNKQVQYNLALEEWSEGRDSNLPKRIATWILEQEADMVVLQEFGNINSFGEIFLEELKSKYELIEPKPKYYKLKDNHSYTLTLVSNRISKNTAQIDSPEVLKDSTWARWVELKYEGYSILGVHIPEGSKPKDPIKTDSVRFWNAISSHLLEKVKVIVIGDMNVNLQIPTTTSTNSMKSLKNDGDILDAWEHSVAKNKAYTINDKGSKQLCSIVDKDTFLAVSGTRTRIDYALCSSDIIIEEMIVDDKTREFTDHSAIKLKVKMDNN